MTFSSLYWLPASWTDKMEIVYAVESAMNTELSQISEYKTFLEVEPGEDLSKFQKIPYHFVFDVKLDLGRKGRLVAGDDLGGLYLSH
jgi:hypothetical protein